MARPKDMMPNVFSGKEEEWPAWRESVEDYVDKIKPGMKDPLRRVAKHKAIVTNTVVTGGDLGHAYVEGQWELNDDLYSHLKSKTTVGTEAKTIVTCAEREGGLKHGDTAPCDSNHRRGSGG